MAVTDQHKPVDWNRIAERLQAEMAKLVHSEETQRYGNDFYAEALRRTLGYIPADQHGRDRLQRGEGLTTEAYAKHLYESHAVIDRINREKAEKQVAEMRAELRRVYAEAAKDLAQSIRQRCNERTVPSRYRREGVLWAADLIDPAVPKDRYGNVLEPAEAGPGGRS